MSTEILEKQSDKQSAHDKLRKMARLQGVKPLTNFANIPEDFWPENERVDDFLDWVERMRKSDDSGRGGE
jgi:hypothetical protein